MPFETKTINYSSPSRYLLSPIGIIKIAVIVSWIESLMINSELRLIIYFKKLRLLKYVFAFLLPLFQVWLYF